MQNVSKGFTRHLETVNFFFKMSTMCFIEDIEGPIFNHNIYLLLDVSPGILRRVVKTMVSYLGRF